MVEIIANDEYGNSLTHLVQWDSDINVYLNAEYIDSAYRVHFFNNTMDESLVVESTYSNGVLKAKIPNILLTQPYIIFGYVNVVKNGGAKSLYSFRINVRKKPKPSNYLVDGSPEWIEVETIVDELHSFAKAAEQSAKESANSAKQSEDYYLWSKSYAIGEGGKRSNENVENAKYYYEKSKEEAGIATGAAKDAEGYKNTAGEYKDAAADSASEASDYLDSAEQSAKEAAEHTDKAEQIAESVKNLSRWANTIIDDVTALSYFIGIENGVVYFSDEFKE